MMYNLAGEKIIFNSVFSINNMPFLRFHAIEKDKLARVGERLISGIVSTLGCPRETVVLEVMNSSFVSGDDHLQAYPFVKVEYFKRPVEQQDALAKIIFECLKEAGYPDSDVYFSFLEKERYYENGEVIK
ncbi:MULTISPECIES: DUF1904 family protein [Odoribacteraceae]|uniref:DUF1904 family protein n=1 Tax=Odoribacteraceae TaxID=1853231 RepID=UPI001F4054CF|nr:MULTISPECIES: DUF1904 family protein [Odoribacteraceae]MCQ4874902.1 DUF1904 domain-containing protein [Butyricimonas paravirosa]